MLWIFVRITSPGDSNKYPQHMFLEGKYRKKVSKKVYSGKFFLTAESWGTNAVVITRVLCN